MSCSTSAISSLKFFLHLTSTAKSSLLFDAKISISQARLRKFRRNTFQDFFSKRDATRSSASAAVLYLLLLVEQALNWSKISAVEGGDAIFCEHIKMQLSPVTDMLLKAIIWKNICLLLHKMIASLFC